MAFGLKLNTEEIYFNPLLTLSGYPNPERCAIDIHIVNVDKIKKTPAPALTVEISYKVTLSDAVILPPNLPEVLKSFYEMKGEDTSIRYSLEDFVESIEKYHYLIIPDIKRKLDDMKSKHIPDHIATGDLGHTIASHISSYFNLPPSVVKVSIVNWWNNLHVHLPTNFSFVKRSGKREVYVSLECVFSVGISFQPSVPKGREARQQKTEIIENMVLEGDIHPIVDIVGNTIDRYFKSSVDQVFDRPATEVKEIVTAVIKYLFTFYANFNMSNDTADELINFLNDHYFPNIEISHRGWEVQPSGWHVVIYTTTPRGVTTSVYYVFTVYVKPQIYKLIKDGIKGKNVSEAITFLLALYPFIESEEGDSYSVLAHQEGGGLVSVLSSLQEYLHEVTGR